jgi:hypothetical protein
MIVLGLVLGAYVVAYPAFALTYFDIGRFPRHLWTGFGRPQPWRQATVATYLLGGLPVLVTAVVWRTSGTRASMRAAAHASARRASARDPRTEDA